MIQNAVIGGKCYNVTPEKRVEGVFIYYILIYYPHSPQKSGGNFGRKRVGFREKEVQKRRKTKKKCVIERKGGIETKGM